MKKARNTVAYVLFSILIVSAAASANAQEKLSVTLTPPLYQLTIGPGESWTSSLKVVNNNPFDVTYYAQLVDMEANGETGQSRFIPILDPQDPTLVNSQLARWIHIEQTPIFIKAGQSRNLQFTVDIPQNAEPGGHYAAILVGTQPLSTSTLGSQMKISSFVSSLLFVRVKGEVIEAGRIREFTSDRSLYQTPKADFVLRFENTGNTHLKPEGSMTIYNMWGKERGSVKINQGAGFGNVLPQSIRRFEFSWEGEENVFDIGRYSASVTLAYGEDGRKNISATTYFWVIPLIPVSITLGILLGFVLMLVWFIRRYIRRALALERERFGVPQGFIPVPEVKTPVRAMIEPLREGVVDLRSIGSAPISIAEPSSSHSRLSFGQFLAKYRLFFAFIIVILVAGGAMWFYFGKVLVPERPFNIETVDFSEEERVQ